MPQRNVRTVGCVDMDSSEIVGPTVLQIRFAVRSVSASIVRLEQLESGKEIGF